MEIAETDAGPCQHGYLKHHRIEEEGEEEMKRIIYRAETEKDYLMVTSYFSEGYVLDPFLTDGKPYRLDSVTIWPLVFYESDAEKPVVAVEEKKGEFEDVIDVKDATFDKVEELIKQGYTVQSIYAKSTILVKRKPAEVSI